ncbi:hypothetical protein CAC42_3306 [Sphaceloma murrayae]|uniref:DUF7820 domain-containing protein n=1 Tax=Sphaceloma murrayae TaxID=2082308 RepID=A0A2K1QG15_9PEZI|nr:hypothetical protein CAC42_3306 [Sphaceloma murrayae]
MISPVPHIQRQDSTAARSDTSNVFGDRFEIDDYSPVDGMDGRDPTNTSRRSSRSSEDEHVTSVAAHYAEHPIEPTSQAFQDREARNSIRKSRTFAENPFRSEYDESGRGPSHSTQGTLALQMTGDTYRSDNSLSGNTVVSSTQSMGHRNGPSHPYEQYTQNTSSLTRSPTAPSTITAQTTGRQSLHGPSHQYNMYPQNVEEDIDDTQSQVGPNQNIPLGFPPTLLNVSTYRHDSDNLSEQLPPYSEYPEDGAPKHVTVPPRIDEVSPTSDIMLTPRDPQSMSDANRGVDPMSSDEEFGSASEKKWKDKTWKEKRKTRFCGVAFGWIVLGAGVLGFIVIVLSATIGGFFGAQAKAESKKANDDTLIDASPIRSSMMPLATGNFQLQLGSPQEIQAECLTDQSQAASWDCGISSPGALAISIGPAPNGKGQGAFIYQATNDFNIGYGTDIPHTIWSALQPVKDMDAPNRGPAYQFQTVYTKIVIAREDAFQPARVNQPNMASSSSSPSPTATANQGSSRKSKRYWASLAQSGDQPWICYWNNTRIEGFIYVHENSTSWYGDEKSGQNKKRWPTEVPTWATSTPAWPAASLSSLFKDSGSSVDTAWYTSAFATSTPSATPTTSPATSQTLAGASNSPSSTVAASACTWSSGTAYPANPTYTPATCPPALGDDPWSKLDLFPFVVKIEERRVPGDTMRPYCQKMQVLDNGQLGYLMDDTNRPYIVELSESSPGIDAYTNVYGASSRKMRRGERKVFTREEEEAAAQEGVEKRAVVNGACHCQWISGEN